MSFQVQRAANIIKDIGERGQADLGLDYAWLDDVTVQDWNVRTMRLPFSLHGTNILLCT